MKARYEHVWQAAETRARARACGSPGGLFLANPSLFSSSTSSGFRPLWEVPMESAPPPEAKQLVVSSFLEIAVGQTADIATQFLEATGWNLEEALQLFYVGNEGGAVESSSLPPPVHESPSERENVVVNENIGLGAGDDEVRAPLPVKRDTLYGDLPFTRLHPSSVVAFRNFDEESKHPAVWESEQNAASTTNGSRDNLASLYRPPFALMYQGPFDRVIAILSVPVVSKKSVMTNGS